MNRYIVNFRRLALLALPTFMRRPAMTSILFAAITPIRQIYMSFMSLLVDTNFRLDYNGQVCYLEGVLNDMFDPSQRRIYISEEFGEPKGVTVYQNEVQKPLMVYSGQPDKVVVVNRAGYGGLTGYDFWVNIPELLKSEIDLMRLTAVVNSYKLASKRFQIA